MRTGKTSTGFEFEIDEQKLDDMEFLDALAEVDDNSLALPKIIKTILGYDQKKKLYDHLRSDEGRVPIKAVAKEIAEIMKLSQEEVKN